MIIKQHPVFLLMFQGPISGTKQIYLWQELLHFCIIQIRAPPFSGESKQRGWRSHPGGGLEGEVCKSLWETQRFGRVALGGSPEVALRQP